jgi:hypothetical protein
MKTKMLVIALAIVCSSIGYVSAQKEKKVYAYCFGYLYETKIIYISPVVSGYENRKGYVDATVQALSNQWQNAVKKETEKFFAYYKSYYGWSSDYDAVDNARTDMIREYKSKGFTVYYIDDFWFRQKEME